jgi:multidrug resistance efflux pump
MHAERSRLLTRRRPLPVALAALYLRVCFWAEDWRPTTGQRAALAEFEQIVQLYDEGRVTATRVIQRSQELMQAQLDIKRGPRFRIESIEAHLGRVDLILERERREMKLELHSDRGRRPADLAEAEQLRGEAEALLAREKRRAPVAGTVARAWSR